MEPELKKEHKVLPILLTVLIMLFLTAAVAGGVWFYMDQQAKKTAENGGKQAEELQKQIDDLKKNNNVATTIDPTANWETYNDPTYNFSFKYPKTLVVTPSPSNNTENFYKILVTNSGDVLADGSLNGDVSLAYLSVNDALTLTGTQVTIIGSGGNKIVATYETGETPMGATNYSYEFNKDGKKYLFSMGNFDGKPILLTPDQFETMVGSFR